MHRFLDVMPFIPLGEALGKAPVALAITVGFAGLVALAYLWLMRRVPLFPLTDPRFMEAVAVGQVEG